jgi:hypothetical protein
LARTERQLQERSSSHSRRIQCSKQCGEYLGVKFAESPEDINTIINNSTPQQQKKQGWSQPRSTNQVKYQGNSFNFKQPSLRDLILEQDRINDNIVKALLLMIRS